VPAAQSVDGKPVVNAVVTLDFKSTMSQQSFVPGANAAMISQVPDPPERSEMVFDLFVVALVT
jgi:hypothetical protein